MEKETSFLLRDSVYRQLLEAVARQQYQEGDVLNERAIAEQLQVSRTPVREAIQMLEREGWVTVEPRKGIFVRAVTPRQVDEVFQIRTSLETLAVELLMQRITPEAVAALRGITEEQKQYATRQSASEFMQLDRAFHNTVARYAGSELLEEYLQNLDHHLMRLGLFAVRNLARFRRTVKEHEKVLDALEAGNQKKAVKAMCDHIEKTRDTLMEQLLNRKGGTA